jgi:hypothetical protein
MKLGRRTAKLVQEAAVLGFVEGVVHAHGRTWEEARRDFPPDLEVLARVLRAAHSHADLYPTLSRVEEAR